MYVDNVLAGVIISVLIGIILFIIGAIIKYFKTKMPPQVVRLTQEMFSFVQESLEDGIISPQELQEFTQMILNWVTLVYRTKPDTSLIKNVVTIPNVNEIVYEKKCADDNKDIIKSDEEEEKNEL